MITCVIREYRADSFEGLKEKQKKIKCSSSRIGLALYKVAELD